MRSTSEEPIVSRCPRSAAPRVFDSLGGRKTGFARLLGLLICVLPLLGCNTILTSKVRAGVEALNRGDLDAVLEDWADDAVLVYPGDVSASGETRGKDAIRAWFENWRRTFPEFRFTIIGIHIGRASGPAGSTSVAVETLARGRNRFGAEVGGHGITVFTIGNGKIVRVRDFIFEAHRLRELWGEELRPVAPRETRGPPPEGPVR